MLILLVVRKNTVCTILKKSAYCSVDPWVALSFPLMTRWCVQIGQDGYRVYHDILYFTSTYNLFPRPQIPDCVYRVISAFLLYLTLYFYASLANICNNFCYNMITTKIINLCNNIITTHPYLLRPQSTLHRNN